MSGNMSEQAGAVAGLIVRLRDQDAAAINQVLAREINNHIFLRGTFCPSPTGELDSRDVAMILDRFDLALRTIQLSGPGVEQFAPSNGRSRVPLDMASRVATELGRPAPPASASR